MRIKIYNITMYLVQLIMDGAVSGLMIQHTGTQEAKSGVGPHDPAHSDTRGQDNIYHLGLTQT